MPNVGYFIDSIGSQPWYRCLQCKYDGFLLENIRNHVALEHKLRHLPDEEMPIDQWIYHRKGHGRYKKVAIGLLTWNTREASQYAAHAIHGEKIRLAQINVECSLFWADNGSTDGTVDALNREFDENLAAKSLFSSNMGQSKARNDIIGHFLASDADYLLMVDGDVQIVPWSAFAMMMYLENGFEYEGCIGMYCRNCTHDSFDPDVAQECRKIEGWMATGVPSIAWTNYGMFHRSVLESCKFDESGPFDGPGWGFEDDDFDMQMQVAGYSCLNTKYFRHLHRRRHSSVKILGTDLAAKSHAERKAYLLDKWKNVPQLADRVRVLANQTMPTLEY